MSRDCDEALANLYTYLDGEVDRLTATKIRAHIDACSGCGRPFDFEARLKVVVRQRLNEEVPEPFLNRLRTALAAEIRGAP